MSDAPRSQGLTAYHDFKHTNKLWYILEVNLKEVAPTSRGDNIPDASTKSTGLPMNEEFQFATEEPREYAQGERVPRNPVLAASWRAATVPVRPISQKCDTIAIF